MSSPPVVKVMLDIWGTCHVPGWRPGIKGFCCVNPWEKRYFFNVGQMLVSEGTGGNASSMRGSYWLPQGDTDMKTNN